MATPESMTDKFVDLRSRLWEAEFNLCPTTLLGMHARETRSLVYLFFTLRSYTVCMQPWSTSLLLHYRIVGVVIGSDEFCDGVEIVWY
jgi:hypothetical protein